MAMLGAVGHESLLQSLVGILAAQVQLAVPGRALSRAATDHHTVSPLVVDLSEAGRRRIGVGSSEEGNADEADLEVARSSDHPPRRAACLVVKGGEEVPGDRGIVLAATSFPGSPFLFADFARVVGTGPDQLQRHPQLHGSRLQQVMESNRTVLLGMSYRASLGGTGGNKNRWRVYVLKGIGDLAYDDVGASLLHQGLELAKVDVCRAICAGCRLQGL